jgi:hypothetical protein
MAIEYEVTNIIQRENYTATVRRPINLTPEERRRREEVIVEALNFWVDYDERRENDGKQQKTLAG